MSAEFAARLTAARAAAADFSRAAEAFASGGPAVDWLAWSHRLGGELTGLLDGVDLAPLLTPKDRRTIVAALADAAECRGARPGGACDDRDMSPAGLCDVHAADLDQADEYRALAVRLGEDR